MFCTSAEVEEGKILSSIVNVLRNKDLMSKRQMECEFSNSGNRSRKRLVVNTGKKNYNGGQSRAVTAKI